MSYKSNRQLAEHKREEVQAFIYDEDLHQLEDLGEQEFVKFLGVDETFLEVEHTIAEEPRASGKKAGKRPRKEASADPSEFSRKTFVRAANTLAKSMKEKHFPKEPLLVFKSTRNKSHRGQVTDTQCKPDITAAFDKHWGDEGTTLWPCIQLAGAYASKGQSKDDQIEQAISYLHYLLLARPDLYVAQGLLISKKGIIFLLGIAGKGICSFSVAWTDPGFYKFMYAFVFRLYDPGDFMDRSYVKMDLQNDEVAYTINVRISQNTEVDGVETECAGFSPIYASSPFGTRTHILSNPRSDTKIGDKILTVFKDQLCQHDARFEEYTVLTHIHSRGEVPGVVEAAYHKLIDMPERFAVTRKKHRIGLYQSGSPITSVPTLKGMLGIVFDVLELLRYLRCHRKVLHRDISRGDILYMETTTSDSGRAAQNTERKEVPLCFIKYLIDESTDAQETSALLIDFNHAEILGDKDGPEHKRTTRTGTAVFIARAVEEGGALPLPEQGLIASAIPTSPGPYTILHPDRIKKFPFKKKMLVEEASLDNVNRQWRHELDHDAESVFWLLLYWALGAQPAQRVSQKEEITRSLWELLKGSAALRNGLVQSLASGSGPLLQEVTHSFYQPLSVLLSKLAAILVVDRHWLDKSDTRNDPEYIPEAFQRLILQFILDNRDKEFMTKEVDIKFRQVKGIEQNLSLLTTESSRRDTEHRKRPSPRPSMQRMKRPRLAEGVEDASQGEEDDKEGVTMKETATMTTRWMSDLISLQS